MYPCLEIRFIVFMKGYFFRPSDSWNITAQKQFLWISREGYTTHWFLLYYLKDLLILDETKCYLCSDSDKIICLVLKTILALWDDVSFHKAEPLLWNNLPIEICMSNSLWQFKTKTKSYLHYRYYNLC